MIAQTLLQPEHYHYTASTDSVDTKAHRKIERMVKELSRNHPLISNDTIRQVVIAYYDKEALAPHLMKKFADWIKRKFF